MENIFDQIDCIISKFKSHTSILKTKQNFHLTKKFSIKEVSVDDFEDIAESIRTYKTNDGDIPLQDDLSNVDFSFEELKNCVNLEICNGKFLDTLKQADISSFHQEEDLRHESNFCPANILPFLSKIIEKVIDDHVKISFLSY